MRLSDEQIEEIRINNDIVDVIGEYVRLERKGQYLFGLCPFHKEKTPSFSVTPSRQMFRCFGCGKGGNVFHFIMNAENLDFIEAVRLLADRARIQLPEGDSEEEKRTQKLKQEILKINVETARFFHKQLNSPKGEIALKYLNNRKISENTIRKFGIGYSLDDWDLLHKHLSTLGFSYEALKESGLLIPNKNGGYFDRFRGRVIFPIFDLRGNVIGFGGRIIGDAKTDNMGYKEPKYMNSPETLVYNKGRNLYALNYAKNSGDNTLIIVEGYMDVISLHQNGIINTVASLGTALTESQGRILKKYAEEIIICYDADMAGQSAAMRGLDLLNDIGCNVKVLTVPDGKDPDEFIKKNGQAAFRKLIEGSLSLIEYKIKYLKNQIDVETTDGKLKFLNKTADVLTKVDNRLEREINIKKLSKDYGISEESLYAEVMKRTKPKGEIKKSIIDMKGFKDNKSVNNSENRDLDKLIHLERMLIMLFSIDNSVYKLIKDRINRDYFIDENRQIASIVLDKLENNKGIVAAELFSVIGTEAANEYSRIIQDECNFEDNKKAVLDILKKIEIIKLEKRRKEILELLSGKNDLIEGDVEQLKEELKLLLQKQKSL
ncbi:DNA primase [Pseudobacteroides cellulosolvens]|uniref:DNA primase n=1 Tax=Pseudobacteroides cellulosolvens ATCC 35603 = DSM 2933 TaxID=398512 RepID=A0A0L6JIA5_9FIRM|nr:DNA primase [Pseudobacteroides cellulosolvens]KNY25455.1 DNA primase [Pseudobacteroides cellulosolvens ATCC 35603 = DSM 2933]